MILTFNAKIIPTNSVMVSPDTFDMTANVSDSTGMFSGLATSVGNIVFLDTFGSMSAPATISKYKVIVVNSKTGTTINVRIQFIDTGTPIDPIEAIGIPGYIAAPSALNELAFHPGSTVQGIPEYVMAYARNQENFNIIDSGLGGSGSGKAISEQYLNNSGAPLVALTPVRHYLGSLQKVNPSTELEVKVVAGVTNTAIANATSGIVTISGLIQEITTAILVNSVVYLAKDGSITDTTPDIGVGGFLAGDFVVQIGKVIENASNSSNKDLLVDIKLLGQL